MLRPLGIVCLMLIAVTTIVPTAAAECGEPTQPGIVDCTRDAREEVEEQTGDVCDDGSGGNACLEVVDTAVIVARQAVLAVQVVTGNLVPMVKDQVCWTAHVCL